MMTRTFRKISLASALSLVAVAAWAQSHEGHQPYAGLEQRQIKALSDQQVADLRAGRGMSLALAAELNGYPGPLHVLEHAGALGLSDDQKRRTETAFAEMKAKAAGLGERLIAQE